MWSQFTNVTDGRTDRQTTCDRNTALCTKVHRAVKTRSLSTLFEICLWCDLELLLLHDVTSHVTIWYPRCQFYSCSNIRVVSPTIFEIMGHKHYRFTINITRPHDIISHMTIRFAICHFLTVVHWSLSSLYLWALRDIFCIHIPNIFGSRRHRSRDHTPGTSTRCSNTSLYLLPFSR